MSWWTTRYKARPASNRPGARIAWDELSQLAAPRPVVLLWYAREMNAWCARLDHDQSDEYIEMDELEVSDRRNNPHKYRD